MVIYVPLIPFGVAEEGQKICDGVLQWFHNEADAKSLYPNDIIQKIEIRDKKKSK